MPSTARRLRSKRAFIERFASVKPSVAAACFATSAEVPRRPSSFLRIATFASSKASSSGDWEASSPCASSDGSGSHGGQGAASSRRMRSSVARAPAQRSYSSVVTGAEPLDGSTKRHDGHVEAVASHLTRHGVCEMWLPLHGMHTTSSPASYLSRQIGHASYPSADSRSALACWSTSRGSAATASASAGPPLEGISSCRCTRRLMRWRERADQLRMASLSVARSVSTYAHAVRVWPEKRN